MKSDKDSVTVFSPVRFRIGPEELESAWGTTGCQHLSHTLSAGCRMPSSICTPVLLLGGHVTPEHPGSVTRLWRKHTHTHTNKHTVCAHTHAVIYCSACSLVHPQIHTHIKNGRTHTSFRFTVAIYWKTKSNY